MHGSFDDNDDNESMTLSLYNYICAIEWCYTAKLCTYIVIMLLLILLVTIVIIVGDDGVHDIEWYYKAKLCTYILYIHNRGSGISSLVAAISC